MNVFNKVTLDTMRRNKTRTLVTVIGIIVSVALFTAVTTLAVSVLDFLIRGVIYEKGDYHVAFSMRTEEEIDQYEQDSQISDVANLMGLSYFWFEDRFVNPVSSLVMAGDESYFNNMPIHIIEGRLPENSGEIVIDYGTLDKLSYYGYPHEIGDSLTMNLTTRNQFYDQFVSGYPEEMQKKLHVEPRDFTKTYTIVGIAHIQIEDALKMSMDTILTYADGNEGEPMWHHCFIKTYPINHTYTLIENESDMSYQLNTYLLLYQGANGDKRVTGGVFGIAAVLCIIILIGSVGLIYNSFSISVTQRTKEFGLLFSIGATKKQIRSSVFFEAGMLCFIGIPVGILLGWTCIAIAIRVLGHNINPLFSWSENGSVQLRTVISAPAVLAAAIIGLITVYLSAWIPAYQATKITPMEAIRQTQEYKVNSKAIRVGKLTYKFWGVPGVMAIKYYKVSRKMYRATVLSLAVSVLLFISAVSVSNTMAEVASSSLNMENFDMALSFTAQNTTDEQTMFEQIRQHYSIEKAAYFSSDIYHICVAEEMYSNDMLEAWDDIYWKSHVFGGKYAQTMSPRYLHIYYLEDTVLEEYLIEQGIDPTPYLEDICPKALVCNLTLETPEYKNGNNEIVQFSYEDLQVLSDNVNELTLYPSGIWPENVIPYEEWTWDWAVTRDNELLVKVTEAMWVIDEDGSKNYVVSENNHSYYVIRDLEKTEGGTQFGWYEYDPLDGSTLPEPVGYVIEHMPSFRLGACINELPFGIASEKTIQESDHISIILPLSADPQIESLDMSVSVPNVVSYYNALEYFKTYEEMYVTDYLAEELNMRGVVMTINIFSYSFLILISLISCANVFNTVYTNISLRRKDFGMLKSIGMQTKDMYRMMAYECILYGSRALMWGIPFGVLSSLIIHTVISDINVHAYVFPIGAVCMAIVCILVVVFSSILYAVGNLKKDNPIEAIRMDNA